MSKSIRFRVRGRVQGVFFRASAKEQAGRLGIGGWVRNCADGDVEGLATGTPEQLASFSRWLEQGPAMADVSDLLTEECDYQDFDCFEIR